MWLSRTLHALLFVCGFSILSVNPPLGIFYLSFAIVITALTETTRRISREYRRSRRNRHHSRTGTGTVAYTHAGAGEEDPRESSGLTIRYDEIPIIAYKLAVPIIVRGIPSLMSLFTGMVYTDKHADRAFCRNRPYSMISGNQDHYDHVVPEAECTCGFYAMRDQTNLGFRMHRKMDQNTVLLEVELFGKVIVHEMGYRAERQRFLHVWVGPCWYAPCKELSVALQQDTVSFNPITADSLVPTCTRHRARQSYDFAELTDLFGCPVGHDPNLR